MTTKLLRLAMCAATAGGLMAAATAGNAHAQVSGQVNAVAKPQKPAYIFDRGWHVEAKPGVFFSLGGTRGISDVAPYVALSAGYDINFDMSVGLQLMMGGSSNNPRLDTAKQVEIARTSGVPSADLAAFGEGTVDGGRVAARDFTAGMVNGYYQYRIRVADHWAIPISALVGVAFLAPGNGNSGSLVGDSASGSTLARQKAKTEAANEIYRQDPLGESAKGPLFNAGLSTGFFYFSRMRHFMVGVEVSGFFIVGPNIPALAAAPTFRYTF